MKFCQIQREGTGTKLSLITAQDVKKEYKPGGEGVKPYMGYIGTMCRCEGYGFQAVYSGIGYINQSVWVQNRVSFFRKLISCVETATLG